MQAKIQLIRIDNRLVHGQVGVTWTNSLNVDTIVVVNDNAAQSSFAQKLMQSIASAANVAIRFYSVEDFTQVYQDTDSMQKLFVIVANPHDVRVLMEGGVPLPRINVGNMHYEKGRLPFNRKVYLNQQDIEDFNWMLEHGAEVFYQDVPGAVVEKMGILTYESMAKRR